MKPTKHLRFVHRTVEDKPRYVLQQKWVDKPREVSEEGALTYGVGDRYYDDSIVRKVTKLFDNRHGALWELKVRHEEWRDVPVEEEDE